MSLISNGNGGGGAGPDFNLPCEILSVIPTDPYDQLDLARKITSMAIASRVTKLEMETGRLRQTLSDKDRLIVELADRVSQIEQANQDLDLRLNLALQENLKIFKERDSLAATAKKLGRDLSKLESFKRHLMHSLNEDDSSQTETVDIRTCDQMVPKTHPDKVDEIEDCTSQNSGGSLESGKVYDDAPKLAGQIFSLTPYLTPRLTPTGTPKIISASGSPRKYSSTTSPRKMSGSMSPSKGQYDGGAALATWYPPSQRSSAANSPPRDHSFPGRAPRIDGKEFFRQARSRLSYEQFSAFLANIKEFNARKQTREETLRKAEEIFDIDNKDLYLSFQGLLNRNVR